jgi:hypothetical protein
VPKLENGACEGEFRHYGLRRFHRFGTTDMGAHQSTVPAENFKVTGR